MWFRQAPPSWRIITASSHVIMSTTSKTSTTGTSSCPQCGGTEVEKDAARGDVVCMGCGCVLEEDLIVSELTFQEQSSGALALVGQFVSTECMLPFIRNIGIAIMV